jgi:hypothetical protein
MPPSRGRGYGGPPTGQTRRREDEPRLPEVRVDHRLVFESEPFARFVGDWWGLRMIALLVVGRKRRAREEWVAPFPWSMVLLGFVIWVVVVLVIVVVAALFAIMRAKPYGS